MHEGPTEAHRARTDGRVRRLEPVSSADVGKKRGCCRESHQKAKAPVLRVAYDRAESLRRLRTVEVYELVEENFFEEKDGAENCNSSRQSEASSRRDRAMADCVDYAVCPGPPTIAVVRTETGVVGVGRTGVRVTPVISLPSPGSAESLRSLKSMSGNKRKMRGPRTR
jgi:hypothetical protein